MGVFDPNGDVRHLIAAHDDKVGPVKEPSLPDVGNVQPWRLADREAEKKAS